jgi:uncharacterized protein (DUF697 family)
VAKIHPGTILGLVKEMRVAASDERSIVVAGARELAAVLARELGRDAAPGAVRTEGSLEDAAVVVYVLAGPPSPEDVAQLRLADLGGVPVICVRSARGGVVPDEDVPYVLATDVVEVPAGAGFPLDEIVERLASRLGEKGTNVARRVPVLRDTVARHLVASFSTKAAWTAAAWFVPGGEFLPLTIRQTRLVLRIAHVYGHDVDPTKMPEVGAVLAGAYGWRGVARRAMSALPLPHWAVRGGVAYAGTRAVGEAAIRRFGPSNADRDELGRTMPPPAAASRAAS